MVFSKIFINPSTASGELSCPHFKSLDALSQASIPPKKDGSFYFKIVLIKILVKLEQKLKVSYMSISLSTSPEETDANWAIIFSSTNFPFVNYLRVIKEFLNVLTLV